MAGGVDDVDQSAFPGDRAILGENGDAAFAFQVIGVHHAFGDLLVGGKGAGLAQQFVDEGGFAMINVGDDGYVA